jgi:hypothetical protein
VETKQSSSRFTRDTDPIPAKQSSLDGLRLDVWDLEKLLTFHLYADIFVGIVLVLLLCAHC